MDDYQHLSGTQNLQFIVQNTAAPIYYIRNNAPTLSESPDSTNTQDARSLIRGEIHKAEVRIKTELKDELITSIIPDCIKEAARLLNEGYSEAEIQAELMKLFFSM